MWINSQVVSWFTSLKNDADSHASLSRDAMASLREDLAAVRSERDALKLQAAVNQTHMDWFRTKINQLEMERAGLIERAYQIKLPSVPELVRTSNPNFDPNQFSVSFDDMGDELAKKLGLPVYGDPSHLKNS